MFCSGLYDNSLQKNVQVLILYVNMPGGISESRRLAVLPVYTRGQSATTLMLLRISGWMNEMDGCALIDATAQNGS